MNKPIEPKYRVSYLAPRAEMSDMEVKDFWNWVSCAQHLNKCLQRGDTIISLIRLDLERGEHWHG